MWHLGLATVVLSSSSAKICVFPGVSWLVQVTFQLVRWSTTARPPASVGTSHRLPGQLWSQWCWQTGGQWMHDMGLLRNIKQHYIPLTSVQWLFITVQWFWILRLIIYDHLVLCYECQLRHVQSLVLLSSSLWSCRHGRYIQFKNIAWSQLQLRSDLKPPTSKRFSNHNA